MHRQWQYHLHQWVQPKAQRHLQGFAEMLAAITNQETDIRRCINLLDGAARDIKLFVSPHLSPPVSSLGANQYAQPKTSYQL